MSRFALMFHGVEIASQRRTRRAIEAVIAMEQEAARITPQALSALRLTATMAMFTGSAPVMAAGPVIQAASKKTVHRMAVTMEVA